MVDGNQEPAAAFLRTKSQRGERRLFPEKVGKVGDFLETKRIGDLGDIPVGLFQQDLCFLGDPAADKSAGGLSRIFFQHFV